MTDTKNSAANKAAAKADADAAESMEQTPGVSADAEKIDAPLVMAAAGPRDALVEPMEGDIIPDHEEKGYHVGLVRQPAELVGTAGRVEGFRSIADMPSKFAKGSLDAHKAAHNAMEEPKSVMAGPAPGPEYRLVRVVDEK